MYPINRKKISNLALAIVAIRAVAVAAQVEAPICPGYESPPIGETVVFGALTNTDGRWLENGAVGYDHDFLNSLDMFR